MGTNLLFLAVVKHRKRSLVIAAELFSNHFLDHESVQLLDVWTTLPSFLSFWLMSRAISCIADVQDSAMHL